MKNGKKPDPNAIYPIPGYNKEIYVKPVVANPNVVVGDFTYIADWTSSAVSIPYSWRSWRIICRFPTVI